MSLLAFRFNQRRFLRMFRPLPENGELHSKIILNRIKHGAFSSTIVDIVHFRMTRRNNMLDKSCHFSCSYAFTRENVFVFGVIDLFRPPLAKL